MGLRFADQEAGNCFFVTTTFDDWKRYGDVAGVYKALGDSLSFCLDKYKALLPGYVFMPSHVHFLVFIEGDALSGFMRDFKKFTAQKALKDCGVGGRRIWKQRFDRVMVVSEDVFRTKLEYIHNNPVKGGEVSKPDGWKWSSAGEYLCDVTGPVQVWTGWG